MGEPLLPVLYAFPSGHRRGISRLLRPGKLLAGIRAHFVRPIVAVGLYVASLGRQHITALYVAAQGRTLMHDLEHAMFHGAALLYWWPIVSLPKGWRRLKLTMALLYPLINKQVAFANQNG